MTISATVFGSYHQSTCPPKENNRHYERCINESIEVMYHCSNADCRVSQQNSSYVQGCQAARLVATRTFSCSCSSSIDGRKA